MIFNQQMPAKRTQIITGTLANPFVGMDDATYAKFQYEYYYGITTARLDVDTSLMGYGVVSLSLDISVIEPKFDYLYMENNSTYVNTVVSASVAYPGSFLSDPFLTQADFLINGTITDVRDYAEHLPTTLTIYWGGGYSYKEVITGTVENPFGNMSHDAISKLCSDMAHGSASAKFEFDASALGFSTYWQPMWTYYSDCIYSVGTDITASSSLCNEMRWGDYDDVWLLSKAYLEQNGVITDLKQYASLVPSTLTIYHHPILG